MTRFGDRIIECYAALLLDGFTPSEARRIIDEESAKAIQRRIEETHGDGTGRKQPSTDNDD